MSRVIYMLDEVVDRTAKGYAGFWRRVAAALIDLTMVWLVASLGFCLIVVRVPDYTIRQIISEEGTVTLWAVLRSNNILAALCVSGVIIFQWLYHALSESSSLGSSPGKFVLGVQVRTIYGDSLSFVEASLRHFSKVLSVMTCGVGFLLAGTTKDKQAMHDVIAGTVVVRNRPTQFTIAGSLCFSLLIASTLQLRLTSDYLFSRARQETVSGPYQVATNRLYRTTLVPNAAASRRGEMPDAFIRWRLSGTVQGIPFELSEASVEAPADGTTSLVLRAERQEHTSVHITCELPGHVDRFHGQVIEAGQAGGATPEGTAQCSVDIFPSEVARILGSYRRFTCVPPLCSWRLTFGEREGNTMPGTFSLSDAGGPEGTELKGSFSAALTLR